MKKVLFTATVDSHILQFHLPFLKLFKEKGYEVHVATNGNEEIPYCDVKHVVSFERSPLKINNLKAIKQLRRICDREKFDIIHTHTPMGSVVTRLAARKARKKHHTRVIYTAHGFHFFKGASIKNWLIFYPVEKYLAKYTDTLITINQEDYNLAKNKFSKRCKDIEYVPGVGIDEEKFDFKMSSKEKSELRKSLGLSDTDFVMIYVARLDANKNQGFLIEVMRKLVSDHPDFHLLLVGPDELNGEYQQQANDLLNNVHFLGYRKDIPYLLKISDLYVSSSLREGLPVNILEALASDIPVVATDARGVRDLVEEEINGYVIKNNSIEEFCSKILLLYKKQKSIKTTFSNFNSNEYLLKNVLQKMEYIYNDILYNNKNIFINKIKNIKKYLQLKINKINSSKRNNQLNNKDFTIISNNCFGGVTYEYLDLPFNSPTIGLYFFAPEYIKFIDNIKYYTSLNLTYIQTKESKYYNELKKLRQENVIIGKLDDIEIVFLHYNSFNEAKEKWEKRCKRINYKKIIYKFNDQNLCTAKELEAFKRLKLKNKICFTSKEFNYNEFIYMKKYKNCDFVKEDAFYYHKYLDIVQFINHLQ